MVRTGAHNFENDVGRNTHRAKEDPGLPKSCPGARYGGEGRRQGDSGWAGKANGADGAYRGGGRPGRLGKRNLHTMAKRVATDKVILCFTLLLVGAIIGAIVAHF